MSWDPPTSRRTTASRSVAALPGDLEPASPNHRVRPTHYGSLDPNRLVAVAKTAFHFAAGSQSCCELLGINETCLPMLRNDYPTPAATCYRVYPVHRGNTPPPSSLIFSQVKMRESKMNSLNIVSPGANRTVAERARDTGSIRRPVGMRRCQHACDRSHYEAFDSAEAHPPANRFNFFYTPITRNWLDIPEISLNELAR